MYSPDTSSSPFSSPVRKRQRLSSPTYDGQLGDFSQADLDAFDEFDAGLSQLTQKSSSQPSEHVQRYASDGAHLNRSNAHELTDDPDNPFTANFNKVTSFANASSLTFSATFSPASAVSIPGFTRASAISVNEEDISRDSERSPSPSEPPNQDYDAWFQQADIPPISFQTASSAAPIFKTPAMVGFSKASNQGFLAPSSAALAKAQEKMKEIWQESDSPGPRVSSTTSSASPASPSENVFISASRVKKSPGRPILQSVVNSSDSLGLGSPSTPTPDGPRPLALTLVSKNSKPFKSPLLARKPTMPAGNLETSRTTAITGNRLSAFSTARSQHPLASAPINAQPPESRRLTFPSITTPARHPKAPTLGSNVKKSIPTGFVTPFKPGMAPGQPGRLKLEEALKASQFKQPLPTQSSLKRKADWLTTERPSDKAGRSAWIGVFNLTPPANRETLQSSGLIPQQFSASELEAMGINPAELSQITPAMAKYYKFHTPEASPLLALTSTPPVMLGPEQAFNSLLENGCSLATQDWVNNHWGLILWKLAGMVGLDPQRENIPSEKRWCWAEVMRQMFYRYEREHNRAQRPALRLITTRDAPAAYPMILCVSDIFWNKHVYSEEGVLLEPHPELEVTDGWYRLRARIDAPMARAVRRGHIRIGRKIAVAGAYLSSEKKDPSEALDAYNSVNLVLSGNSTHMAPWHAKLGFQPGPCISTLHSLTPDGGMAAAMDLVVVKTHPIAYIELVPCEGGSQARDGPMNASEEAAAHEKWKKQYEVEMSKLRLEYEKRWDRYEGYLDRLERRAGEQEFRPSQDDFPQDILENMYDELEDPVEAPNVLAGLGRNECGSLARFVRERLEKDKLHALEDMENELQHTCPPRNVKNFRIIVVQDARTAKYPGNRKALLNVWDVLSLSFSEGASPGSFEIGQRFMVTNLKPTHQKSWMGHEPNAEVYLCTGQHSRWTPIRA